MISINYYKQIKQELLNYETTKKVKEYSINRSELETKYNVGKMLIEAQGGEKRAKYGNGLIKEYVIKLKKESGLNYSERSLREMRQFYIFSQRDIWRPMVAELSWTHCLILMRLKNDNQINYYIKQIQQYNLSKRQLEERIKQKEYERLPESTKDKLLKENNKYEITDFIKDPIIIRNTTGNEVVKEKVLQKLILEDIPSFLEQLGEGFTFVKNEYKIKVDNTYNYIDLLLFNYIYNSFIIVELKITKLNKNHIGQIEIYMNYIDRHLKKINQNKTIGIIISREGNNYVMSYCSDNRIFNTTYELEVM